MSDTILKDIDKLDEQNQDILLLNLLYDSKLFTELNKNSIINMLLNNKKEELLEKTSFAYDIITVKQQNSAKQITKIIDNLDEVCILYEKIKHGERIRPMRLKGAGMMGMAGLAAALGDELPPDAVNRMTGSGLGIKGKFEAMP